VLRAAGQVVTEQVRLLAAYRPTQTGAFRYSRAFDQV
jgi:hypothetical protein